MAELAALFSQYLCNASSSGQVPTVISPAPPGEHTLPSEFTPPANRSSPCKLCLLNTPCSLSKPGQTLPTQQALPQTLPTQQVLQPQHQQTQPAQLILQPQQHQTLPAQQISPLSANSASIAYPANPANFTQFAGSVLLPIICNSATPCSSVCPAATADTPRWVHRLCCITGQKSFVDATQHTTQPYTNEPATISLFSSWMHA